MNSLRVFIAVSFAPLRKPKQLKGWGRKSLSPTEMVDVTHERVGGNKTTLTGSQKRRIMRGVQRERAGNGERKGEKGAEGEEHTMCTLARWKQTR